MTEKTRNEYANANLFFLSLPSRILLIPPARGGAEKGATPALASATLPRKRS